jgi:hypothetical protein
MNSLDEFTVAYILSHSNYIILQKMQYVCKIFNTTITPILEKYYEKINTFMISNTDYDHKMLYRANCMDKLNLPHTCTLEEIIQVKPQADLQLHEKEYLINEIKYTKEINTLKENFKKTPSISILREISHTYMDRDGNLGDSSYDIVYLQLCVQLGDKIALKELISEFLEMEIFELASRYMVVMLSNYDVNDYNWINCDEKLHVI